MLPKKIVTTSAAISPPDAEVHFSMCHVPQLTPPQPIARWILEDGQLLGVIVAVLPTPPKRVSCH